MLKLQAACLIWLKPVFLLVVVCTGIGAVAQKKKEPPKPVYADKNGKLQYTPDSLGNRIPDFSYSGYAAGDKPVPLVAVKAVVPTSTGDATEAIQAAIDYVSELKPGSDGFRGAVQLQKGTYHVNGTIFLHTSGVVLRGAGMDSNGTQLVAAGLDRIGVIRIGGKNNRKTEQEQALAPLYVPVNSRSLKTQTPNTYRPGDHIRIRRPSTDKWIAELGTAHFGGGITSLGWKPGQRDLYWDRTVLAVNGNELTLDAPLTTALDPSFGGAMVARYTWTGRVSQAGVENILMRSTFDGANAKDENHRWNAISIENAIDIWVRRIEFLHFAGSAVYVAESVRRTTVEDCISRSPVSEIAGGRRETFFTAGQQGLFQRLFAENGIHDFATGYCTTGPNAFVQCQSVLPFGFSGTTDSWASGVLFDIVNVDGQALSLKNRGQDGQGAGWTAANSMIWQCSAARIDCEAPPGAMNWALGNWAQFAGNAYWDMSNEQIQPRSFYYGQLQDRLGADAVQRAILLPVQTEASSSPQVSVAMELTRLAATPAVTLDEFIRGRVSGDPLPVTGSGRIVNPSLKKVSALSPALKLENGWLTRAGRLAVGARQEVPWWNGSARPHGLRNTRFHITRFVPGREGAGLTDNLDQLTDSMQSGPVKILEHNYGLWYDRRRDDHERIRRMDGDVWAPFYELPFARSGQDTAWDGLSKYDLGKYNEWYWDRLKTFADLADRKGLTLIHQNYFQHNIIEAGAHYADFPWRTANNVNDTGFPEPVPYAGDKRIFMADQFYDLSDPKRRSLHRLYIRKCLENFAGNNGVIQLTSAEYTGPLHFVQFWLDAVAEWKKQTGKHPVIGLSTTKDVQDAILADPQRAAIVDLIDIRYWHYQADGAAYAPPGGKNLAPRQHARLLKPKKTSFDQVYRAVSEYRRRFPDKAVMYSADNAPAFGWASLMAGGSLADLQGFDTSIIGETRNLQPAGSVPDAGYLLSENGRKYVVYHSGDAAFPLDLSGFSGNYELKVYDLTGKCLKVARLKGGDVVQLVKTGPAHELAIVTRR
ncbi:DUF6298 domain-containing protein [Pedobacter sp. SYP-B3415]|uniref:DUF6298 domain-containing protein n=1 Tax=Pedobacter sp. SYP-B3415 TaxID=2496641 RepID=UPI00197EEA84|nr:DUF6298 domain-containing protein [Pedobacter sp. SYP-B3415]